MIALRTPELAGVAAWPEGLLLESRGGPVAGFLMPRVDGLPRDPLALRAREPQGRTSPEATWAFLVRAARNLAAAFETVHRARPRGRRRQPGQRRRLAPRPWSASSTATPSRSRTRADLALPRGRAPVHPARAPGAALRHRGPHPRARRLRPRGPDLPPSLHGPAPLRRAATRGRARSRSRQAIREGLFAFGWEGAAQGSAPPPHSLRLTDVPPAIRSLLRARRSGGDGGGPAARPTPRQWVRALDALERSLVRLRGRPRPTSTPGRTAAAPGAASRATADPASSGRRRARGREPASTSARRGRPSTRWPPRSDRRFRPCPRGRWPRLGRGLPPGWLSGRSVGLLCGPRRLCVAAPGRLGERQGPPRPRDRRSWLCRRS